MRNVLNATLTLAWPSLRHAQGRLLGLPFVVAAVAPGLVFPWQSCFAALMVASLAIFLVYLPLTVLALNGGRALRPDQRVPPLTIGAYTALLVLWTATAWLGAAIAPALSQVG